jgi:hypothetical protein
MDPSRAFRTRRRSPARWADRVNRLETAANIIRRVQRVCLTDTDDHRGGSDMAFDQPRPAADTPDNPEDGLQILVVDPAALGRAARLLGELPGPHSPTIAAPTAEAVGGTTLATVIAAFHNHYRDVAVSLAVDNDTTATHMANAAAGYRRAENRVAALLADAARLLPATPDNAEPDGTEPDNTQTDNTWPDNTAQQGTEQQIRHALEV